RDSRPGYEGVIEWQCPTTDPGCGTRPDSTEPPGPPKGAAIQQPRLAAGAASEIRASSRRPADESQSKHYYAKNDSVIHKRKKRAAAKILKEPGDHRASGYGADRDADYELYAG